MEFTNCLQFHANFRFDSCRQFSWWLSRFFRVWKHFSFHEKIDRRLKKVVRITHKMWEFVPFHSLECVHSSRKLKNKNFLLALALSSIGWCLIFIEISYKVGLIRRVCEWRISTIDNSNGMVIKPLRRHRRLSINSHNHRHRATSWENEKYYYIILQRHSINRDECQQIY